MTGRPNHVIDRLGLRRADQHHEQVRSPPLSIATMVS
jgi:hypothetical protein